MNVWVDKVDLSLAMDHQTELLDIAKLLHAKEP